MAEVINPPTYYFEGIQFNPSFYENQMTGSGDLTKTEANALYLQKTVPDTATVLQTFSSGIKTNSISTATGYLSLPASTTTAPADLNDNSTRVPTTAWIKSQNYTSSAGYVTYNGVGPFTTQQSFSSGIKSNNIVPYTAGGTVELLKPTVLIVPKPDDSTLIPNTNWVNWAIGTALTNYALKTATNTWDLLQMFSSGIKTNSISTITGNLGLPASTTTAPADLNDNSTRVPTTAWIVSQGFLKAVGGYATYAGTTAFSALQTFNLGIKTNSISTIAGNLSLPASTTTTPADLNDNSTLIPTTAWIVSQGFLKSAIGYATYAGTTAFTALQTFNLGLKTNSISTIAGNLSLPASTTTTPADLNDNSTLIPTTAWIKSQNYTSSAGYVTYNGDGPFTTQQTFSAGIVSNIIDGSSSSSTVSLANNLVSGILNLMSNTVTSGTINLMYSSGSLQTGIINIGQYFTSPTTGKTTTNIRGDVNIGSIGTAITMNSSLTPAYSYPITSGNIGSILKSTYTDVTFTTATPAVIGTITGLTKGVWILTGNCVVSTPIGNQFFQCYFQDSNTPIPVISFQSFGSQAGTSNIGLTNTTTYYMPSSTATITFVATFSFSGTAPFTSSNAYSVQAIRIA